MKSWTSTKWIGLGVFALTGACAKLPLVSPGTPDQSLPGGGGAASSAMAKRNVDLAEKAQAPSRELDLNENAGGRLTMIEIHRQKLREIDELKATVREKDQKVAALELNQKGFADEVQKLQEKFQKLKEIYDRMEQENKQLSSSLISAELYKAELEKQILQWKINALKEKKGQSRPVESATSEATKPHKEDR